MKKIKRGLFYAIGGACCYGCFHRNRHKHRDKQLLAKTERRYYKKETKKELKDLTI